MKPDKPDKIIPDWIVENVPEELINSALFRFNVELQVKEIGEDGKRRNKSITVDMLPDLAVDYENLEQQILQLPAQYAFWAAVYSESRANSELAERALKIRRSQLVKELKRSETEGGVKLNNDQYKLVIEGDSELVKLDEKYQRLQKQSGKLYHMMEAIKMKADLSRTLAVFKRNELNQS